MDPRTGITKLTEYAGEVVGVALEHAVMIFGKPEDGIVMSGRPKGREETIHVDDKYKEKTSLL